MNSNRKQRIPIGLAMLLIGTSQWPVGAAPKPEAGREIFLERCAHCHGRNGEGVKDKYDGPLRGERTLDKLARYIENNMPDDDPGTCLGEEAQAVARYIYDAFYSPEAQARINPVRIELARLTNRQYAATIADLLKHFTGQDPALGDERGLRATYYKSKDFSAGKKAFERVDREVDFDFGENAPEMEPGTNGFSIQWRGSLIADETGDYEFILKTPNGARLWVNDEDEPLIDAWVASGQMAEHRATLRLLGGRAYPLLLNFFKFKDKRASVSLQWRPPHGTQRPIPARNFAPERTTPTWVITTPFAPDDSSVGYERGVLISKAWDEAATQAAIEVANYMANRLDRLAQSKPADTNRAAKVEALCEEFVARAFRHPLTEEQKRVFVSNQFKKTGKLEDAVKRVTLLTLKSPHFLYLGLQGGANMPAERTAGQSSPSPWLDTPKRSDGGSSYSTRKATRPISRSAAPQAPDAFAVAERLSFGLCDSLPDEELWKAASHGELRSPEQVTRQAQRMLGDPRTHAKMLLFLHHWLQMDRVEPLSKDDQLFPGFTPEIIADLRTSLDLFLEDAVWNGPSDYRTLLQADYLFANRRLAEFYGHNALKGAPTYSVNAGGTNETATQLTQLTKSTESTELNQQPPTSTSVGQLTRVSKDIGPDDFVKMRFDAEQRSGVLTHPYLLSAFSYQKLTSPIHRGVFLTRNIVGRALRPPPMAMTFKDAEFAPNLTMREKVSQMTRPQACQACHSVINPLGFSLESFDAVGRFRTQDNQQPVNSVSDYVTADGQTVHFAGARDVAEFALRSEQAQNTFIEQLFHHVVKQPVRAYGIDVMRRLRQSFVASDFNLQQLLADIAIISAVQGMQMAATGGPR